MLLYRIGSRVEPLVFRKKERRTGSAFFLVRKTNYRYAVIGQRYATSDSSIGADTIALKIRFTSATNDGCALLTWDWTPQRYQRRIYRTRFQAAFHRCSRRPTITGMACS